MDLKRIIPPALIAGVLVSIVTEFVWGACCINPMTGLLAALILIALNRQAVVPLEESVLCGALAGLSNGLTSMLVSLTFILMGQPLEPGMQYTNAATWVSWALAILIATLIWTVAGAVGGAMVGAAWKVIRKEQLP